MDGAASTSTPGDKISPVLSKILSIPNREDPRGFAKNSEVKGFVVGQPDGDGASIKLANGKFVTTRLGYIDTPETDKPNQNKKGQPYGNEAMQYLHGLMKGKEITAKVIEPASEANYWRPVVELFADGKNLNEAMLESGYAWPQKRYLPQKYNEAAVRGYSAGNIFSEYDPESPGAFRARTK